jgi:hypothetical protein
VSCRHIAFFSKNVFDLVTRLFYISFTFQEKSAIVSCRHIAVIVFIYSINEHKKGQFEPASLGKLFAEHFSHCGNKVQMIRPQLSFNSEHELRSKNKKRTRPKWILLRATLALMIASKMYFESTHGRWKVVLESTKKVHFNLGTYKACYFLRKFVFRQYVCGKHCLHASCHPEKNIMCRLLSTVCTLYQHPVT